jgi:aldehyde dehydrogenase (NAD+)
MRKMGGGYYCRPTIITNVKPSMKILNEETLAPILPVMSYQDTEEICEWVNGITQAHSGAIFSKTPNEAIALGDKLSIPYLSINDIALEEVLQVGQHPQMTPKHWNLKVHSLIIGNFLERKLLLSIPTNHLERVGLNHRKWRKWNSLRHFCLKWFIFNDLMKF